MVAVGSNPEPAEYRSWRLTLAIADALPKLLGLAAESIAIADYPADPRPLQFDSRRAPMLKQHPAAEEKQQLLVAASHRGGVRYRSPHDAAIDADSVCAYLDNGHHTFAQLIAWVWLCSKKRTWLTRRRRQLQGKPCIGAGQRYLLFVLTSRVGWPSNSPADRAAVAWPSRREELVMSVERTHPACTGEQPGGFVDASVGVHCRQDGYLIAQDGDQS